MILKIMITCIVALTVIATPAHATLCGNLLQICNQHCPSGPTQDSCYDHCDDEYYTCMAGQTGGYCPTINYCPVVSVNKDLSRVEPRDQRRPSKKL